jgi:hypothetical protein
MSRSQLTRRRFLATASWSAAGLGAAGLLAAQVQKFLEEAGRQ